jgi:DNA-binding NtrC family response regulator
MAYVLLVPSHMREPISILVVDDEAQILSLLGRFLERCGFRVHKAQSCAEALRAAERNSFQLITLDILLSDGDGYETLLKLKQKLPHTPVVVITGMPVHPAMHSELSRLGAAAVLDKSGSLEQLIFEIRSQVNGYAAEACDDRIPTPSQPSRPEAALRPVLAC